MASARILNKVNKINEALNITLADWQIDLIFYPKKTPVISNSRIQGKDLALKIKRMLDTKAKYIWKLGDPFTRKQLEDLKLISYIPLWTEKDSLRGRHALLNWRKVYRSLQNNGLKLAEVKWFKKDGTPLVERDS